MSNKTIILYAVITILCFLGGTWAIARNMPNCGVFLAALQELGLIFLPTFMMVRQLREYWRENHPRV
jgi:hypothetical protein